MVLVVGHLPCFDGADSFLPRFTVNVREERALVTGGSQPTTGKEMIWGSAPLDYGPVWSYFLPNSEAVFSCWKLEFGATIAPSFLFGK